jgi:hypothetical protein
MGSGLRSKPITALLHDPACTPFCFAQATGKPIDLRHNQCVSPDLHAQDTHNPSETPGTGGTEGSHPCRQATLYDLHPHSPVWYSVDMRKEEDPADFPRAIIDLMVNADCMAQESLATFVINPRVYFPLQMEPSPQQSYHGSICQPS